MVVTHVPICEEQMCRKPGDRAWGFSNAYFGNLTLGRRVLAMPKVRVVVSGHTHIGREGVVTRPDVPDLPPVRVSVVDSEYNSPGYLVVKSAELDADHSA